MNRIHRIVWNEACQTHVVAHEKAATNGKPSSSCSTIAAAVVGALMLVSGGVHAGPCPSGGGVSTVSNGNICDAVANTSVNFQGTSGTAYVVSGDTITGATAANNAANGITTNM